MRVRLRILLPAAIAATIALGTMAGASPRSQIGTIFRNGPYAFRVNGVRCHVSHVGTSALGKWAAGQYCVVRITYENITKSPAFIPGYYTAKDVHGNTYVADNIADTYANIGTYTSMQINPNYGSKFKVYFDVPKSDKLTEFVFASQYGNKGTVVRLN